MVSLEEFLKYRKDRHIDYMEDVKQKEIELQSIPYIDNIALWVWSFNSVLVTTILTDDSARTTSISLLNGGCLVALSWDGLSVIPEMDPLQQEGEYSGVE